MGSSSGSGDWREAAVAVGVSRLLLDRAPGCELAAHRLILAGKTREAEAAYRAWLEVEPNHKQALARLANLLMVQGRQADAAVVRRRIIKGEVESLGLSPEELSTTLAYRLAVARLGPSPDRAPSRHIARSFDGYASRYEAHMTETLRYRGPEALDKALSRIRGDSSDLDVLDVGCGTGLAAPSLRRRARRLDGIDLSPGMLERARRRQLYDDIALGDAVEILPLRPEAYDLVVALDVVVYLGDLLPFFRAVALTLRADGRLLLTSEIGSHGSYRLEATGRFTHAPAYLSDTAARTGHETESFEQVVLREEMGRPVDSVLAVFRRVGRAGRSEGLDL